MLCLFYIARRERIGHIVIMQRNRKGEKKKLEERGIDPLTSRMLSERSTI